MKQSRSGGSNCNLVVAVVVLLAVSWGVLWFMPSYRSKDLVRYVEAQAAAQRLSAQLLAFRAEFGRFPDDISAAMIQRRFPNNSRRLTGKYSNDYLRQLVAVGIANDESSFYVETACSPKSPDGNLSGDNALGDGEVGFGYIMDDSGSSADVMPESIVAVAPFMAGQMDGLLDPNVFAGEAVVVYANGRVVTSPILSNGKLGRHKGEQVGSKRGDDWDGWTRAVIKLPAPPRGHPRGQ